MSQTMSQTISQEEIKPIILTEPLVPRRPDHRVVCRCRPIPRPLHTTKITYLLVFSFIALVLFFPTGVLACYFAYRTKKTFYDRSLKDNFQLAMRYSILAERFVICSALLAVITGAVALSMWQKLKDGKDISLIMDDTVDSVV